MIKKAILAILLLLAAGIFVAWATQSHWLPEWNEQLADDAQRYQLEGRELGLKTDQKGCFETTLTRFDTCSGFACTINHGKFLRACWQGAQPTPGFCEGVPEFNEEKTEDEKSWARHSCWERDIRGEGCRLLMRQQQQLCSSLQQEQAPAQ